MAYITDPVTGQMRWVPDTARNTSFGIGADYGGQPLNSWYSADVSAPIQNSTPLVSGVSNTGTWSYDGSNVGAARYVPQINNSYQDVFSDLGVDIDSQGSNNGGSRTDNTITPAMRWVGLGLRGVQAATGLANTILGFQQYKQGKRQFQFQKDLANRNLANQASLINTQLDSRTGIGNGLAGSTLSTEEKAGIRKDTENRHVDGSYIG